MLGGTIETQATSLMDSNCLELDPEGNPYNPEAGSPRSLRLKSLNPKAEIAEPHLKT